MNNLFNLRDRNIVITGASSGIGRQCAISCSQMGANVILIARNEERLKETYNQLEKGEHLYYSQDITKYEEVESIIKDAVSKTGKMSGFIHSAGIGMTLPFIMLKPKYYYKVLSVNTIAGLEIARILSKKKYNVCKGSSFVFISSVMGLLGDISNVAYCCSKGALLSASKAIALELASKNIRVNCILPGIVKTKMANMLFERISKKSVNELENRHPLGFGTPEDVANACIFLLSNDSKWITGTNLIVDGGYSSK